VDETLAVDLTTVLVALVIFGVIGALIAPRKGVSPWEGFALGFILGIFGVAYLAIKRDKPQMPYWTAGPPR
jgi:hypothetical protein